MTKTRKKGGKKENIWLQKLLKEINSCHGNCQNLLCEYNKYAIGISNLILKM